MTGWIISFSWVGVVVLHGLTYPTRILHPIGAWEPMNLLYGLPILRLIIGWILICIRTIILFSPSSMDSNVPDQAEIITGQFQRGLIQEGIIRFEWKKPVPELKISVIILKFLMAVLRLLCGLLGPVTIMLIWSGIGGQTMMVILWSMKSDGIHGVLT